MSLKISPSSLLHLNVLKESVIPWVTRVCARSLRRGPLVRLQNPLLYHKRIEIRMLVNRSYNQHDGLRNVPPKRTDRK